MKTLRTDFFQEINYETNNVQSFPIRERIVLHFDLHLSNAPARTYEYKVNSFSFTQHSTFKLQNLCILNLMVTVTSFR